MEGCTFAKGAAPSVTHRLFRRDDGVTIPENSITVSARATVDAAYVTVRINRRGVAPGNYKGAVIVDEESIFGHKLKVPMAVTAQYDSPWILGLIVFPLTAFAGGFTLWAKTPKRDATQQALGSYIVAILFAAGTGLGAAAGIWISQYLNDPTWGSHLAVESFTLLGLMVGGFVAAATGASLVSGGVRAARG